MHDELRAAIISGDYDAICQFLCVHFPSDSNRTVEIREHGYIQGWRDCERVMQIDKLEKLAKAARKLGPPGEHIVSGWDLSDVFYALKELDGDK